MQLLLGCIIIGAANAVAVIVMRLCGVRFASQETKERMKEWGVDPIKKRNEEMGIGSDRDVHDW